MTKPKVLLLHGWGGSEDPHWQAWLTGELAKRHYPVHFPRLPDMYNPKKKSWIKRVDKILEEFTPDIVVCHSLGCILWFHMIKELTKLPHIKQLVLVSPPSFQTEIPKIESFFPVPEVEHLNADHTVIIGSDNDPYVSLEEIEALASRYNASCEVMMGAGHINKGSGFGPFPKLLLMLTDA